MKLNNFHTIIENTPEEINEDVNLSMDILERIHELLDEKFGGKQKLLAAKLGKSEAEVSKWLSGVQNFTTRTLVKLQIAFGEPIIAVCTKNNNATFIQVKVPYKTCQTKMAIDGSGKIEEQKTEYADIKNSGIKKDFKSNSKQDLLI
jgi:transcriptional regulator with XRE-family HTH domain